MAFTLICFIFICFFSNFFCSLLKAASCKIGRGKERSKLSSKHTLKKTGGWRTSLVARAHAAPAEAESSVTSTCWAAHLRLVLQPQGSGCFWSPWAPLLTHITQNPFWRVGKEEWISSYSSGFPGTHCVVQADLEFIDICIPLPPKCCWD